MPRSREQKKQAIDEQYTTKYPSASEIAKLLRNGELVLRKDVKHVHTYDSVGNLFDFSEFEPDTKLRDAALAVLAKQTADIQDQIMLGDNEKALELIEAFAA